MNFTLKASLIRISFFIAGKGNSFVCRGKRKRLFVVVQGKGRKLNLFLFPEHLQTILFPSLYIYKQSCSLYLPKYKQTSLFFPSRITSKEYKILSLGAYIFYIRMKNELWENYGSIHICWPLECPFRLKFRKKLIMCLCFVCSLLSNHLFSLYLVITGRDILQKRGSVTINISTVHFEWKSFAE